MKSRIKIKLFCMSVLILCTSCTHETIQVEREVLTETVLSEDLFPEGYAVGDILLSDGTKIDADKVDSYTEIDQAAFPVAVAAYARNGKLYCTALKFAVCKWTIDQNTVAFHTDIEGLQGTAFGGVTDGSTSLGALIDAYKKADTTLTDEQAKERALADCPAFNYAEKYGSLPEGDTKLTGTEYEYGWYLPSAYELGLVLARWESVKKSLHRLHAVAPAQYNFDENKNRYWSSSAPGAKFNVFCSYALWFNLRDGKIDRSFKYLGEYRVLPVRCFSE